MSIQSGLLVRRTLQRSVILLSFFVSRQSSIVSKYDSRLTTHDSRFDVSRQK